MKRVRKRFVRGVNKLKIFFQIKLVVLTIFIIAVVMSLTGIGLVNNERYKRPYCPKPTPMPTHRPDFVFAPEFDGLSSEYISEASSDFSFRYPKFMGNFINLTEYQIWCEDGKEMEINRDGEIKYEAKYSWNQNAITITILGPSKSIVVPTRGYVTDIESGVLGQSFRKGHRITTFNYKYDIPAEPFSYSIYFTTEKGNYKISVDIRSVERNTDLSILKKINSQILSTINFDN